MKEYKMLLTIPVIATLQDEELLDVAVEAMARGRQLRTIVRERAVSKAMDALQLGVQQYSGALIVVTGDQLEYETGKY